MEPGREPRNGEEITLHLVSSRVMLSSQLRPRCTAKQSDYFIHSIHSVNFPEICSVSMLRLLSTIDILFVLQSRGQILEIAVCPPKHIKQRCTFHPGLYILCFNKSYFPLTKSIIDRHQKRSPEQIALKKLVHRSSMANAPTNVKIFTGDAMKVEPTGSTQICTSFEPASIVNYCFLFAVLGLNFSFQPASNTSK